MSQLYAQPVSSITTAVDVSMGSSSQCVLLAIGTVKCFGANQYGELGDWSSPLEQPFCGQAGLAGRGRKVGRPTAVGSRPRALATEARAARSAARASTGRSR